MWSCDRGRGRVYMNMLTASSDMSCVFKSMIIFKRFANSALFYLSYCCLQFGLTKFILYIFYDEYIYIFFYSALVLSLDV